MVEVITYIAAGVVEPRLVLMLDARSISAVARLATESARLLFVVVFRTFLTILLRPWDSDISRAVERESC